MTWDPDLLIRWDFREKKFVPSRPGQEEEPSRDCPCTKAAEYGMMPSTEQN